MHLTGYSGLRPLPPAGACGALDGTPTLQVATDTLAKVTQG